MRLQKEEIYEIALGLELSGLPFIWALRRPNWPGMGLHRGWRVSRAGRLPGVGPTGGCRGFPDTLRMEFGSGGPARCALMPMIFDQRLNARQFAETDVLKRSANDHGKFHANGIANTLKMVMVEEREPYRAKARGLKSVLIDKGKAHTCEAVC